MIRRGTTAALFACFALVAGPTACGGADDARPVPPPEPPPRPVADSGPTEPLLPAVDAPLWPSMARVRGEADVALLDDVEMCAGCHQDVAAHWRSSAHARSSFDNPWYRAAVDALREQSGPEASRFCAGCHDPLLLVSGKIDEAEIAPDDPLAHAGVTCMVCHSVVETTTDGNGSWVLETAPVPIPIRGDAASIAAHRDRMRTESLQSATLCGSCHRGFLTEAGGNPHFMPGMDDLGPWRASGYAETHSARIDDELEERTCQGCHMPGERTTRGDMAAPRGHVRSHRFAGGQSSLAAAGDAAQRDAVREMLEAAATIDVAAVRREDGSVTLPAEVTALRPGEEITLDVVIRNVGAGHRFPGGVRDTQDTFVELEVRDSGGDVVAEAGTRHREADDETAHRLTTVMLDGEGHPELRHFVQRFEGKGYDHTIAPRDAATTRYELAVPEDLEESDFPLSVTARLMHRRHVRPMHDAACRATRTHRGQAFTETSQRLGRPVLDGCVPQPITELARAVAFLGPGAAEQPTAGGADRPAWLRLYEHALGLSHQLQEHTDEARPSIERALSLLEGGDPRSRAMVLVALSRIEARQGRVAQAVAAAERAEALIGRHPAIDRAKGDAYAQVWRWDEASLAFGRVVELAPGDSGAWRSYARALGSTQNDGDALRAAVMGLALAPRDEAMLRTQALSLSGRDHADADRARELFITHRRPDRESDLRLACAREVPGCARDQQPVVTIRMRAP